MYTVHMGTLSFVSHTKVVITCLHCNCLAGHNHFLPCDQALVATVHVSVVRDSIWNNALLLVHAV